MSDKPSFFAELKRRNVYKVAVAYGVVAWLLMQVASQIFPFFDIPNWVVRLVVLLLIIGFPVALIIAWAFEVTSEGIKRTEAADAAGQRSRGVAWIYVVLIGVALSVGLFFVGRYTAGHATPRPVTQPEARPGFQSEAATAIPEKSIAVLPLLNESGDPSDEYFSDGLSEELIAALGQIRDLKVIGRSSSFRFKDRKEEPKTIGEKLGVSTLLEGTVRKQGDKVRIVAELINAADGTELWSRVFDRELKDIFAVQTEIAQAVAASLELTLLGSRDRTFIGDLSTEQKKEAWAAARNDAEKAVAVGPNLAEAHAALGWVRFFTEWKFAEGLAELRRAKELAPANPTANDLLARVLVYLGQIQEDEKLARQAIELDPLAYLARGNLARILLAEGKLDEADGEARKSAELQPTAAGSHRWQVVAAVLRGDGEAALREAQLEPNDGYRRFGLALAHYARGDRPAADAALAEMVARDRNLLAYQIAEVYAWRGETDKAFEWLQISLDNHDTGALSLLIDPLLRGLRGDPRYKSMLEKIGLPTSL